MAGATIDGGNQLSDFPYDTNKERYRASCTPCMWMMWSQRNSVVKLRRRMTLLNADKEQVAAALMATEFTHAKITRVYFRTDGDLIIDFSIGTYEGTEETGLHDVIERHASSHWLIEYLRAVLTPRLMLEVAIQVATKNGMF
jgi:hypothetical protein